MTSLQIQIKLECFNPSKMNKPNTAVIFDFDGTLAETEHHYCQIMIQTLNTHGFQITEQEYNEKYSGVGFVTILEEANEFLKSNNLPLINISETISQLDNSYMEHTKQTGIETTLGAAELIRALKQAEVEIAIGSNAPGHIIQHNLEHSGLAPHFDPSKVHSAFDIGDPKPSATVFKRALEKLQTPEINRVFILEDSNSGLKAIQAFKTQNPHLEVTSVLVNNGHNQLLVSREFYNVDLTVVDLQEVLLYLR